MLRAVAATCARRARRSATTTSSRRSSPPAIARLLVDLFRARFDPARPTPSGAERLAAIERGDRRRREPRPGPHPAQLPGGRPGDAAHELLPARRDGGPSLPVLQARPVEAALAAAAAPALRDLRLLAAHRGRPPARRQGRARRHPLVGPARGLPHRGPRPDEGADGQERGDRPGRREGRLRGQAAAGRRAATRCWPRSRPATARSSAACST